jgi:hypothetical protein
MNTKFDLDEVLYNHENFAKDLKESIDKKKEMGMLNPMDLRFINMLLKDFMQHKDDSDERYVNYLKSMLRKEAELPPEVKAGMKNEPEVELVKREV